MSVCAKALPRCDIPTVDTLNSRTCRKRLIYGWTALRSHIVS